MSSTNRGGKRIAMDVYETPRWCVDAILDRIYTPQMKMVLEPCAGSGNIIKAIVERDPDVQVWGMEPRGEAFRDLVKIDRCHPSCVEYMDCENPGHYDLVITNPPFYCAQDMLKHTFSHCSPQRCKVTICYLLRINFLASQGRRDWWTQHKPTGIYILSKRPSFTGGPTDSCDYAWFVWDTQPTRIEWL